ncbi:MAG: dienelactone hydrolase family protein [Oscillospiraceae bacterium]
MRKSLKSSGAVFVSALLLTFFSGCKAGNVDVSSHITSTVYTMSEKEDFANQSESSASESKADSVTSASEAESTSESDKPTIPTESEKEPERPPEDKSENQTESIPESQPESQPENPYSPSSFEARSIETENIGDFRYWLYTPSNPTSDMPLIVYLHGGSGKGEDLTLITSVDGFPKYLQDGELGDVRAYVIIPQLPSSLKGWINAAEPLYSLIQKTASEFEIDENNISLTGHSMGGTGTFNFAFTYPTLFARVAPLSGSAKSTTNNLAKLQNIPIWAFVGSDDKIVPPDSSEEVIAQLQKNGGNAKITVFDGADHFTVPSLTYLDKDIDLISWLIGI